MDNLYRSALCVVSCTAFSALLLCGGIADAAAQGGSDCATGQVAIAGDCRSLEDAAGGIRDVVRRAIDKYDLNSVIVSVRIGDTDVLTEAWGESMAGIPATTDMHFRNGAIAIAYLTTVLLQLHDEGVLSVKDPLAKWFPDYPEADRVTLEMLANSTAGYADYVPVLPIYDDVFRQWTPQQLIDIGLSQPMACEPGTCFAYAHTNYVILGEVLSKAAGKPVASLIRDRILEPLSLSNTQSEHTAVIEDPVLHAFTDERGIYEDSTYWNPSWTLARGAVMTTNVPDALSSAIALGDGRLLSEESHRMQLAPLTAGFPPMSEELYYGLGVVMANGWVMQTPSFGGYAAVIAYLPARRIGFAPTSTMGPETPDERIANRLARAIGTYLAPDHPPALRY